MGFQVVHSEVDLIDRQIGHIKEYIGARAGVIRTGADARGVALCGCRSANESEQK
jgi:hypothetical protein